MGSSKQKFRQSRQERNKIKARRAHIYPEPTPGTDVPVYRQRWTISEKIVMILIAGIVIATLVPEVSLSFQTRKYNKLRKSVEKIFDAEQEYFKDHRHFTADLNKIDLPLPPEDVSKREYERAHYEHDNNTGYFYVPESLIYYTKNGDHFWITVSEEQPSDEREFPPFNAFSVTGFDKNLPVAFSKSYYYGPEYQRQFQRMSSPETVLFCYTVGTEDNSRQGKRICEKAGLPFYQQYYLQQTEM